MRKIDWNRRSGAARANPAIALLLLGAVVAIIVTLLNRESGSERDARTGARYLEQARGASAIDPELIAWEEVIEPIDVPMDFPTAIAVGPDDSIVVAGDRIVVYDERRSVLARTVLREEEVHGLAVRRDGVIVSATATDVEGMRLERAALSEKSRLTGFSLFGFEPIPGHPRFRAEVGFTAVTILDDAVYLADALGRQVLRCPLDSSGDGPFSEREQKQKVFAEGFNVPSTMDLTVTRDGELVTVDPGRLQVQVRDAYGDVVRSFGENGTRIDQFHGCCNPIAIAQLSDGRWVTGEKGLGVTRVKVYSEDGELESVVAGPGSFDEPKSGPPIVIDVAVDSRDRILVLDPVRKQVRTFTPKEDSR